MLSPFKRATQKAATILNFMLISQDVEKNWGTKICPAIETPQCSASESRQRKLYWGAMKNCKVQNSMIFDNNFLYPAAEVYD